MSINWDLTSLHVIERRREVFEVSFVFRESGSKLLYFYVRFDEFWNYGAEVCRVCVGHQEGGMSGGGAGLEGLGW